MIDTEMSAEERVEPIVRKLEDAYGEDYMAKFPEIREDFAKALKAERRAAEQAVIERAAETVDETLSSILEGYNDAHGYEAEERLVVHLMKVLKERIRALANANEKGEEDG